MTGAGERLLGYALLVAAAAILLAPVLHGLATSFKSERAITEGRLLFEPTLGNYARVLLGRRSHFLGQIASSLIVAGTSAGIVLVIGTLAAYSLARTRWSRWIAAAFLGWTLVFYAAPVLTLAGPWYLLFHRFGLEGGHAALVLTHVALNLPMTLWLMMAFFRDIPPELEEAAWVDGASRARAFYWIVLPLALPGLVTAGLLAFVFSWNEFTVALILTSRATATLPVGIAGFLEQFEARDGDMAAAAMLGTLPALLLTLFGQRLVLRGLTRGVPG